MEGRNAVESINWRTREGWTLLHEACKSNDADRIKILLDMGADPTLLSNDAKLAIDLTDDPKCVAVFSQYIEKNHFPHLAQLIDALGEKLFSAILDLNIPLIEACLSSSTLFYKNKDGKTPIHYIAALMLNAKFLLSETKIHTGLFDIEKAQLCNQYYAELPNILILLLNKIEQLGLKENNHSDALGLCHALFTCIINQHDYYVIKNKKYKIGKKTYYDNETTTQLIDRLISNGAGINARTPTGWTCLHQACAFNNADIIETLLEAGADPTLLTNDGKLAVDLTNDPKCLKIFSQYIEKNPSPYFSPVINALGEKLFSAILDLDRSLLKACLSTETLLYKKQHGTPLGYIIFLMFDEEFLKKTLSKEAIIYTTLSTTERHKIFNKYHIELPKILILLINKIEELRLSGMNDHRSFGLSHVLFVCIKNKYKYYDEDGTYRELPYFYDKENKTLIDRLINNGENINVRLPGDGFTPLHFACELNDAEIIKTLIKAGAYTSILNNEGNAPLDLTTDSQCIRVFNKTRLAYTMSVLQYTHMQEAISDFKQAKEKDQTSITFFKNCKNLIKNADSQKRRRELKDAITDFYLHSSDSVSIEILLKHHLITNKMITKKCENMMTTSSYSKSSVLTKK